MTSTWISTTYFHPCCSSVLSLFMFMFMLYVFVDSNPEFAFSIDKTTGVIRVNSSIDREVKAKYTLRVMV